MKYIEMFVQLIICEIKENYKKKFSDGQLCWSALREIDGFCFQVGGWGMKLPQNAYIISAWENEAGHKKFKHSFHDDIVELANQAHTYDQCIGINHVSTIPIILNKDEFTTILGNKGFVRIADCIINPGRKTHFTKVQEEIWNPAMHITAGMMGGYFSESVTDPDRFIVTSFWQSEKFHSNYQSEKVALLSSKAETSLDIKDIKGYFFEIDPDWSVYNISSKWL